MNDPEQRGKRPRKPVRLTMRKYLGDDALSYAIFLDGRPIMTGLGQREARYQLRYERKTRGFT